MRKFLYMLMLSGAVLLTPALPAVAESADALAAEEAGEEEYVIIEEEDVPLAAIPMVNVGQQGITSQKDFYIYAGGALMLLSVTGLLWLNVKQHRRNQRAGALSS